MPPHGLEDGQVGQEVGSFPALARGPDDDAAGVRGVGEQRPQPLALVLVGDASRDADVVAAGDQDQVTTRDGDVGGGTGALAGAQLAGDLDEHLLALPEQVLDRHRGDQLVGLDVLSSSASATSST